MMVGARKYGRIFMEENDSTSQKIKVNHKGRDDGNI